MEEEKAEGKNIKIYQPEGMDESPSLTEDQTDIEEFTESETNPETAEADDVVDSLEGEVDPESDDDELVITFEGEAPDPIEEEAKEAPSWVKELRKKHRESEREKKKLEKELADMKAQMEPALKPLPDKPKFEDFAYDEDKYDAALQEWHGNKLKHEQQQQAEKQKVEAAQQKFNERREAYNIRKSEIAKKAPGMDEAEELVVSMFDETKQGILLTATDDPAQLIYALGKNPKKLQDLASIDDPIRFAAEAAKLETRMKVTKRAPKANPERKIQGGASASSTENHLEKLRAEAAKTGDYTKVVAYRKKLKDANAA